MSDEKLRELERRFRETGNVEDEVSWLRERARTGDKLAWEAYSRLHALDVDAAAGYLRWRVRVGDLSQERLELAAYCGHEAAQACFAPGQHRDHDDHFAFLHWALGHLAPAACRRLVASTLSRLVALPATRGLQDEFEATLACVDAGTTDSDLLDRLDLACKRALYEEDNVVGAHVARALGSFLEGTLPASLANAEMAMRLSGANESAIQRLGLVQEALCES